MTFDETLYGRRDDEMDDYGDGAYGDSLEDEEYEEEEEEEEEPESVSVVEDEIEEEPEVASESRAPASGAAQEPGENEREEGSSEGAGQESAGQRRPQNLRRKRLRRQPRKRLRKRLRRKLPRSRPRKLRRKRLRRLQKRRQPRRKQPRRAVAVSQFQPTCSRGFAPRLFCLCVPTASTQGIESHIGVRHSAPLLRSCRTLMRDPGSCAGARSRLRCSYRYRAASALSESDPLFCWTPAARRFSQAVFRPHSVFKFWSRSPARPASIISSGWDRRLG